MEKDDFVQVLADAVPQLIWTNNAEGTANYFNERWFEYTGLTYAQSHGPGWPVIVHEEDTHAIAEWEQAFREKKRFEAEARLRAKDGAYQWHLLRNVPLLDGAGNVSVWFGTATNIQSIKQAQIEFRRTASYLRAILDTAIDFSIITLDNKANIIGWSAGAVRMFGYEESEVLGRHTGILFTEEDRAGGIPMAEIGVAKEKGRVLDERWHMRKDGSRFFMSGVMTPMREYEGFVKVTRDITERKLGEEALMRAEQRSNLAMQSAHLGEWSWDLRENKITFNERARAILGAESSTVMEAENFWNAVHADDRDEARAQFESVDERLGIFSAELRIIASPDGIYRWTNWYGRVIARENGAGKVVIGVVYDISDRKALEKQKDEFISVASHELRTPVTSIKAYTELLHEIMIEEADGQHADLIDKLNTQVDRLISLCNVLLDTTKISQGKLALRFDTVDLNVLVTERLEQVQYLARNHRLRFDRAIIGLVYADRERVGQVISNLVGNAVKYSPAGTEIIVSTEDHLDGAVVRIRDFGPGIAPEDKAQLFTQYFRGADAHTNNQGGFGLGLYISAEIIRQHHGLIGVDSTPGEGSAFYFKLMYT